MFSPSKVAAIRYFVVSIMSSVLYWCLILYAKDNIKVISQSHTVEKIPLTTIENTLAGYPGPYST